MGYKTETRIVFAIVSSIVCMNLVAYSTLHGVA